MSGDRKRRVIDAHLRRVIDAHVAARAYAEGFARGADARARRQAAVVEPATHAHWWRGYEEGRRAIDAAERAYFEELLRDVAAKGSSRDAAAVPVRRPRGRR